jgi:hypothetical protein
MYKTIAKYSFVLAAFILVTAMIGCKPKKNKTKLNNKEIEANAENALDKLGRTMDFEKLPDTLKVAHLVRRWNGCNSLRFVDSLKNMYADNVFYYGERKAKNQCIEAKKIMLLQNRDYYQRIIGGIGVKRISSSNYRCYFTKYVTTLGVTTAIPSYMIFEKDSSGKFRITAESDPQSDVFKKNKKDSLSILMKDYEVNSSSIKGDFDADGIKEILFVINPGESESPIVSFFFNDDNLMPIELEGNTAAYLLNEGDLDGDGGEEFSVVGNSSRQLRVYTFKRGEWKILTQFPTATSSSGSDRTGAVQLAGAGYVNIRTYENGRDTIKKVNIW